MSRIISFCLTALCAFVLCADSEVQSRLDIAVQPAGAQVFVDGQPRGSAPCSIYALSEGRHLVHVEAQHFVADDAFVEMRPGMFLQKSFSLAEEKGLVLVKTTPAGAEVRLDGVSLGVTPLLLTSLASGRSHALELSLNGYQSRRIDVRPEGRTPIVRDETLALDSGVVTCTSEPAGAAVVVNGVERGVTPIELSQIPKGLSSFTFRLAGYRDETRELRLVPGDRQTLAIQMKGLPAKLTVVSSPENARVFLDDDYQGKTPVSFAAVPGEHEIRIELAGHAPLRRKLVLANGGETTEEFRMESVLGRLEVATTPPGVRIVLDGKSVGTTRSAGGDATRSQILSLENVPVGEHSVIAHLDGYQDASRTITVKSKDTGKLFLRLQRIFTPDTEVETVNGSHVGVLVEKDYFGNITLETSPGVRRTFPQETIRKVVPLSK